MQIIILLILIGWLITSLPQDAFIWAATQHEKWSFDWIMSYARAGLLGLLPVLTVWIEVILEQRHLDACNQEYSKRQRRWNRKESRHGPEWAATNPLIDVEDFILQHITSAKKLSRWVPYMFFLLITVISLSYLGYYEEYGRDLKMYHIEWWGWPVGNNIIRPLVMVIRTFITGIVSYVLAKLAAIMDVQSLFEISKAPKEIRRPTLVTNPSMPKKAKEIQKMPKGQRGQAILEFYRNDGDGDFRRFARDKLGVSYETARKDRDLLLDEKSPLVKIGKGQYYVLEDNEQEGE